MTKCVFCAIHQISPNFSYSSSAVRLEYTLYAAKFILKLLCKHLKRYKKNTSISNLLSKTEFQRMEFIFMSCYSFFFLVEKKVSISAAAANTYRTTIDKIFYWQFEQTECHRYCFFYERILCKCIAFFYGWVSV